jgi:asparagine synthase (glutamine-hydrolysing)
VFNGEIYNYRALARRFGGPRTDTDGEVLFQLLEGAHDGDGVHAVRRVLPDLDGVYAFAMMDSEAVVLARDRMGVKQVYFGENDRLVAFASERKALWRIGMRSRRLNPGQMLRMSACGVVLEQSRPLQILPVAYTDRTKAKAAYRRVLTEAVRKRVDGHGKVGVLFSGGVDSVLIARLAAGLCNEVIAYAGGLPGSPDLTHAVKAARSIGIPIRVTELNADSIEKLVPETVAAIEDGDLLQVEAAIPMYAALGLARKDGVRVMM